MSYAFKFQTVFLSILVNFPNSIVEFTAQTLSLSHLNSDLDDAFAIKLGFYQSRAYRLLLTYLFTANKGTMGQVQTSSVDLMLSVNMNE